MIRRTAFSLVEVLSVLSIGSTVLAFRSVRSTKRCRSRKRPKITASGRSIQIASLNNSETMFISGSGIEFPSDQSLTIEIDDHSKIVYAIEKNHVTREQKRPEARSVETRLRWRKTPMEHSTSMKLPKWQAFASLRIWSAIMLDRG